MCSSNDETSDEDDRIEVTDGSSSPAAESADKQVESLDDFDDLYQAGLSADQLDGQVAAFADHLCIDTECSKLEQRIIADLKAYLRPQKAPDSLARRCCRFLESQDEPGPRSAKDANGNREEPAAPAAR